MPLMVRRSRALLRVWGRDPVKMIHGLATADIEAVSPDRGTYTVFLSPKGKMVADARIFALADGELLLDTDPAAQEPLLAHLRKFIPPLFARFEDVSGSWAVVGVYGDSATEAAAAGAASLDLGSLPADAREAEDEAVALRKGAEALVVRTREAGGDGWEFFVPAPSVDTLSAALAGAGADPGTGADLDRLRLLAGRPRWGAELTDAVIPLEAGLLDRAISQSKGCYTGQEVIVRILHRGHVNRHLRRLLAGPDLADRLVPGAELFVAGNEKPRGTVTSATSTDDRIVGLGYVRREVEPPATVHLGSPDGPEVSVEVLP